MEKSSEAPVLATLTFSPALDLQTAVDAVEPENKLRCDVPRRDAGGGGVNVARVLRRLGGSAPCVLPLGGPTGEALAALLEAEGLQARIVPVRAETRSNFTVHDRSRGSEYRFVLPGAPLSVAELGALQAAVLGLSPRPAVLVISGSLPPGLDPSALTRLIGRFRKAGLRVALDGSGAGLRAGLEAGVWLAKPNLRELRDGLGLDLPDRASQREAALSLVSAGKTDWVALSLGGEGAMLVGASTAVFAPALPITPVSTVGAGDSFMAGLVWDLTRGRSPESALATAVAAASATLLSPGSGMARRADIRRLRPSVRVERLSA